jgi:hypothetical protein
LLPGGIIVNALLSVSVARRLPLALLLAAVLGPACNCDPPAVAGGDAGDETPDAGSAVGEDAGGIVGDDDAGGPEVDAGPFTLTGAAHLQLSNGVIATLDLASGQLSWPFGEFTVQGAVAGVGSDLYAWSPDAVAGGGRIVRLDVTDFSSETLSALLARPEEIATDGTTLAISSGLGGTLRVGTLGANDSIDEADPFRVASAVTMDGAGLLISTEYDIRSHPGDSILAMRHCGGLGVFADGDLLCAAADGSGVDRIEVGVGSTGVSMSAGEDFQSATVFSDDTFVAVRGACQGLVTNSSLVGNVSDFCPAQFAQAGGRVFFGEEDGGLLEVLEGGDLHMHFGFATEADGLAASAERFAFAGSVLDDVGLVNSDGTQPRRSAELEDIRALAMSADGKVHVATNTGVTELSVAGTGTEVLTVSNLEGIGFAGDLLYLARGDDGLYRADLSAQTPTAELVMGVPSDALAGCGDHVVVLDDTAGLVYRVLGDSAPVVDADVSGLGNIETVGCAEEQLIVTTDDGGVYARPFDDTRPLRLVTTLPHPARHVAERDESP